MRPKRDSTLLDTWESLPERAPSIMREDRPLVVRVLALIGLFLLVLGTLAMVASGSGTTRLMGGGLGFFVASIGLSLILPHVFVERDMQFRRLYALVGLALLAAGVGVRILAFARSRPIVISWPTELNGAEAFFFGTLPLLLLGLIVLTGVIRNETDAYFRTLLLNVIGGLGVVMIAFSLLAGLRDNNHAYLPGEGAALLILGLLFAVAYIGLQEASSERGYYAALFLGGVGIIGFISGFIRSTLPESTYLVPSGLIIMGMSLVYIVIAAATCFDWPIIVLARRELAAYFFSPVAYLVFIGQLLCGWIMFLLFVRDIESGQLFEPIIGVYIFSIFPVIVQTILVPVLTMRLLSEEKRTGTLEVLLTAPVNEISIVMGKFLASWLFYMLLWLPWWFFLISLRYMGHQEFDYRPILSFTVCLGATSAGFMSMGLFFSGLTANQIIAAVFTFVGMLAHLAFYFIEFRLARPGSAIAEVLGYINYFDFWSESLAGTLAPRLMIFHITLATFFLFATVKVLESRKWK